MPPRAATRVAVPSSDRTVWRLRLRTEASRGDPHSARGRERGDDHDGHSDADPSAAHGAPQVKHGNRRQRQKAAAGKRDDFVDHLLLAEDHAAHLADDSRDLALAVGRAPKATVDAEHAGNIVEAVTALGWLKERGIARREADGQGAPWDAAADGVPVNQEDLLGTLWTFAVTPLQVIERLFGERYSILDFEEAVMVAVDSSEPDLDDGRVGREHYEFIHETFAMAEDKLKIFVIHHHLIPRHLQRRQRGVDLRPPPRVRSR